jgi:hypothetical protein
MSAFEDNSWLTVLHIGKWKDSFPPVPKRRQARNKQKLQMSREKPRLAAPCAKHATGLGCSRILLVSRSICSGGKTRRLHPVADVTQKKEAELIVLPLIRM